MRALGKSIASLVFASGLMAGAAVAQTLPNAAVVQSGTGVSSSYANGTGSISISAVGPGLPPNGVSGSATLTYWIEITGPSNITVPLDLTAAGTADAIQANAANVTVTATVGSNTTLTACGSGGESFCADGGLPGSGQSFNQTLVYEVPTNTPIQVQLTGNWDIDCCGDGYFGGATATGSITTSLAIDASFKKKGYALFVSTGTNPNPVSLLSTLQDELTSFGNPGLESKAAHAQTALQSACTALSLLVDQVQTQTGKPISTQVAAQLTSSTTAIESLIGCN